MKDRVPMPTGPPSAGRGLQALHFLAVESRHAFLALAVIICCGSIGYGRLAFETTVVSTHFALVLIALTGMWWGRRCLWLAMSLCAFVVYPQSLDRSVKAQGERRMGIVLVR